MPAMATRMVRKMNTLYRMRTVALMGGQSLRTRMRGRVKLRDIPQVAETSDMTSEKNGNRVHIK